MKAIVRKLPNKQQSNPILNAVTHKSVKEHFIIALRNDHHYFEIEEAKRNQILTDITTSRIISAENVKEVQKYCEKLKNNQQAFVKKIECYEKQIEQLVNEKKRLTRTTEAIMELKHDEQDQLLRELEQISRKVELGLVTMDALEEKIVGLENKKKKELSERMIIKKESKNQFNDLFYQYKRILNKYNIYEQESVIPLYESTHANRIKPSNDREPITTDEMKM